MDPQIYHNFSVEDTNERCYRDIITILTDRGWRQVSSRRRSKLEKRRLPMKDVPLFIWTINERDVEFESLCSYQICNHFEGISKLTTKMGMCELLREVTWCNEDPSEISPRSYNLGDPIHREEFIDDFNLTAASNILKWSLTTAIDVSHQFSFPELSKVSCSQVYKIVNDCIVACCRFLRMKRYGDLCLVDNESLINSHESWKDILEMSYLISESYDRLQFCFEDFKVKKQMTPTPDSSSAFSLSWCKRVKIFMILKSLQKINPQFFMDGIKNIWIVKAPEASMGVGMKVLFRLDDILECERGMGGRTVQKYIENPLLIPLNTKEIYSRSFIHSLESMPFLTKFDLRIWVLVLSFEPLKVYIYPRVYGRRCGRQYSSSVNSLNDSFIHLTNYSLQKKSRWLKQQSKQHVLNLQSESINRKDDCHCDEEDLEDASLLVVDIDNESTPSNSGVSAVRKLRSVNHNHKSCGIDESRNVSTKKSSFPVNAWSKLSASKAIRPKSASSTLRKEKKSNPTVSESDLLLDHAEIVNIVECWYTSRSSPNMVNGTSQMEGSTWEQRIWPEIKRKVLATLKAAQIHGSITNRSNCFELLGYDVMLDDTLTPWVLEANMSPAMAHRSDEQNSLIHSMCEGLIQLVLQNHCENVLLHSQKQEGIEIPDNEGLSSTSQLYDIERHDKSKISKEFQPWEELCVDQEQITTTRRSSQPQDVSINTEWESSTESTKRSHNLVQMHQRPSSVGSVKPLVRSRSLSSSGRLIQGQNASVVTFSSPIDVSFAAVGRSVNARVISACDKCCHYFQNILLLQRWARRWRARLVFYHSKRRHSACVIQCCIRRFVAQCFLWNHRTLVQACLFFCLHRRKATKIRVQQAREFRAARNVQTLVRQVRLWLEAIQKLHKRRRAQCLLISEAAAWKAKDIIAARINKQREAEDEMKEKVSMEAEDLLSRESEILHTEIKEIDVSIVPTVGLKEVITSHYLGEEENQENICLVVAAVAPKENYTSNFYLGKDQESITTSVRTEVGNLKSLSSPTLMVQNINSGKSSFDFSNTLSAMKSPKWQSFGSSSTVNKSKRSIPREISPEDNLNNSAFYDFPSKFVENEETVKAFLNSCDDLAVTEQHDSCVENQSKKKNYSIDSIVKGREDCLNEKLKSDETSRPADYKNISPVALSKTSRLKYKDAILIDKNLQELCPEPSLFPSQYTMRGYSNDKSIDHTLILEECQLQMEQAFRYLEPSIPAAQNMRYMSHTRSSLSRDEISEKKKSSKKKANELKTNKLRSHGNVSERNSLKAKQTNHNGDLINELEYPKKFRSCDGGSYSKEELILMDSTCLAMDRYELDDYSITAVAPVIKIVEMKKQNKGTIFHSTSGSKPKRSFSKNYCNRPKSPGHDRFLQPTTKTIRNNPCTKLTHLVSSSSRDSSDKRIDNKSVQKSSNNFDGNGDFIEFSPYEFLGLY